MGWKDAILCALVALALPAGQIMFKIASLTHARLEGPFLWRLVQNWPLMAAFAWYAATALLWFFVLTRVPLSLAYVFSLLGSALVPIAAWAIFKEPFSWQMALGYGLMLTGFVVIVGQVRA